MIHDTTYSFSGWMAPLIDPRNIDDRSVISSSPVIVYRYAKSDWLCSVSKPLPL